MTQTLEEMREKALRMKVQAMQKRARELAGQSALSPEVKDRLAAAKAGTLEVSPQRKAEQAEFDKIAEQGVRDPGLVASVVLPAAQGATFGFSDEIAAALASVLPGGPSYDQGLQVARQGLEDARFSRPATALASELAGAVAVPGVAAGKVVAAPVGLTGRIASGAATGAAQGALYGVGSGEGADNRLNEAGMGALGGVIIGGAVPAVAQVARSGLDQLAQSRMVNKAIKSAPSLDELRSAASKLYAQADQGGAVASRADLAKMANDLIATSRREGMDEILTPGAARIGQKFTEAADSLNPGVGFRELDILRKQAAIPAGNVANRTEKAIGSKMMAGIDDFLDQADPALAGSLKEARSMWGQLRRSEMIDKAIDNATKTASGFENGLRIEFRKILNNPKLIRGFNDAEIEAMKTVVSGTKVGNLMRQVGRLGLGISGQSNGLGATVGGIAGTSIGGPIGGLLTVLGGTAAKVVNERITRKSAERARDLVASRNALSGLVPDTYLPGMLNALGAGGLGISAPLSVPTGNALLSVAPR